MATAILDEDRKFLEALAVGNPDLERLESLIARFNMFEALGVVRQELRHSDFLAFLLDPRGSHGLGAAFARSLLQRILPHGHSAHGKHHGPRS